MTSAAPSELGSTGAVERWGVLLLRRFFDALNHRDSHALVDLMAEDATWTVSIDGCVRARYEGRPAILRMLMASLVHTGGTLLANIETVTAEGHVGLVKARLQAARLQLRLDAMYRFAVRTEGRTIVEIVQTPLDPASHERFFRGIGNGSDPRERPVRRGSAKVTIAGRGSKGSGLASGVVHMLEALGGTVVESAGGHHGVVVFVVEAPAGWDRLGLPRLPTRERADSIAVSAA